MRNRLVLLPGWGVGASALSPLVAALGGLDEHLHVSVEPLPTPDSADVQVWLDELDRRIDEDVWLGGWSLGGMLASELAARRGDRCCGLLTLASNPCFVSRDGWPHAMAAPVFDAFLAGCLSDPRATLKRFHLLCAQGAADARGVARALAADASGTTVEALHHGLVVLAQLDTREALQRYSGPQMHLFAGQDALLAVQVAAELLALLPDVQVGLIESAGHAFILEDPHGLAGAIQAFLHECNDD